MKALITIVPILIVLLGLAHSVLGEYLIFRHLRKNGRWIDTGLSGLRIRQIRALWSTWHLLSLFGFSFALILIVNSYYFPSSYKNVQAIVMNTMLATFILSTVFWFLGTKGKHPAWIVFLIISILIWLGR